MKTIKQIKQKKMNCKGQALVEFAITLPLLLLLILGAMDLGRMFYTKIVLTNAAREGANYLAYFPSDYDSASGSAPDTLAVIQAEGDSSNVTIIADDVAYLNCCTTGLKVGVQITQSVDLIFDGVLQFLGLIGGPVTLTSTVYMVVQ